MDKNFPINYVVFVIFFFKFCKTFISRSNSNTTLRIILIYKINCTLSDMFLYVGTIEVSTLHVISYTNDNHCFVLNFKKITKEWINTTNIY